MKTNEIKKKFFQNLPFLMPDFKIQKEAGGRKSVSQNFDVSFKICLPNGSECSLVCDIKSLLQPRLVREAAAILKEKAAKLREVYPILITTFLSDRTKELLKKEGVGYIDLVGNYFLSFKNIYIEKSVDKNSLVEKRKLKTIFKPVSSRILRVLLSEPKRKWKILELSKISNVSLGQTSNVCRRLLDESYFQKDKKGFYILCDPGKILDEWSESYAYTNNEKMMYYSFEQNQEKLIKNIREASERKNLKYALTLLSGGAFVAPFIRGISGVQMYIEDSESLSEWVRLLDLRSVESGGNLSIYIPYDKGVFYKAQKVKEIDIVNNIQLYLDLYNYPTRGKEQAEFLRKNKIKF